MLVRLGTLIPIKLSRLIYMIHMTPGMGCGSCPRLPLPLTTPLISERTLGLLTREQLNGQIEARIDLITVEY